MKLVHKRKPERTEQQGQKSVKTGKVATVGLISGLMLSACSLGDNLDKVKDTVEVKSMNLDKEAVSFNVMDYSCDMPLLVDGKQSGLVFSSDNTSRILAGEPLEVDARRGDILWRNDFVGRTSDGSPRAHVSYAIANIDESGVLLRYEQITECHITSRYFRVNFDGSTTMPEIWANRDVFKVAKTADPDVVKFGMRTQTSHFASILGKDKGKQPAEK